MDTILLRLLDELPTFICIAEPDSRMPVYCNRLAGQAFELMTAAQQKMFVSEMLEAPQTIKFFDSPTLRQSNALKRGRWFTMSHKSCVWTNNQPMLLIVGEDCSEMINTEKLLTVAAYTDELTGIHNRQVAMDMLTKFIHELETGGSAFTVCYIDLNDLKFVNDHYGHNEGDRYILTVAEIIKHAIRRTDIFARVGGDEFLIIFPKCKSIVVENIMEIVSHKLEVINNTSHPKTIYSISYGIVEAALDVWPDMESLLAAADRKMYEMKEEYRKNRVLPF